MHSVGRFGYFTIFNKKITRIQYFVFSLWIFPGFHPSITGACSDNTGSPATFDTFLSYNNDKGAEWVMANNVQFKNFVVFDHKTAGIETKTIVDNSNANTPYSAYFFNNPGIIPTSIDGKCS